MPSLYDMFQPQNTAGELTGYGDALRSRSNSLVGLGLGLMAQRPGETDALRGYMSGAGLDQRAEAERMQLARQKMQDARQRANDAFQRSQAVQQQANWERTFERSDPAKAVTEAQRAYRDIYGAPGTPDYKGTPETQQEFFKQFYLPKTEQPQIVWQEDANGNKVPYRQDPRSGTVTPLPIPGATSAAGGNPYAAGGKMTDAEGKNALFADRAATAHEAITKAENINNQSGGKVGAFIQQNLPAGAANVLVSGERGMAMDAQRSFINALLRRESGAVIGAEEFANYGKEYFPQLGDTSDQIEAKRKHRAEVIAGLAREGGRGYRPTYSFDESGHITRGAPSYAGKGSVGPVAPAPRSDEKKPDPFGLR